MKKNYKHRNKTNIYFIYICVRIFIKGTQFLTVHFYPVNVKILNKTITYRQQYIVDSYNFKQ